MTKEHLDLLLAQAEAKPGEDGWTLLPEGRHLTVYVASGAASLTVSKVVSLKVEGGILLARTARSETYTAELGDVFAGAVDPPVTARKAGFV